MSVEPRRGCGYRRIGGLYLMGGKLGAPCCKLPVEIHVCPTCGTGLKQARGWTWVDPKPWLGGECALGPPASLLCPAADPSKLGARVGLLWVGAAFYKTPEEFIVEADTLGISRRINSIPRGFKLGETWVLLAHPRVFRAQEMNGGTEPKTVWRPGIFRVFKPTALEKIVAQSEFEDEGAMEKLRKAGITPVPVPDGDVDHAPGRGGDADEQAEMEMENASA